MALHHVIKIASEKTAFSCMYSVFMQSIEMVASPQLTGVFELSVQTANWIKKWG